MMENQWQLIVLIFSDRFMRSFIGPYIVAAYCEKQSVLDEITAFNFLDNIQICQLGLEGKFEIGHYFFYCHKRPVPISTKILQIIFICNIRNQNQLTKSLSVCLPQTHRRQGSKKQSCSGLISLSFARPNIDNFLYISPLALKIKQIPPSGYLFITISEPGAIFNDPFIYLLSIETLYLLRPFINMGPLSIEALYLLRSFIFNQMSEEQPKVEPKQQAQEPQAPAQQGMSAEQEQTYNKMMSTLSKMNKKIENAKSKLIQEEHMQKKSRTDEITQKLITSKETSEIITKENLLQDITQSYEKVVIEVYSENSRLKKKVDEMAKIVKDQNAKIYDHTRKEADLIKQNESLRAELAKMKDERIMMARGMVGNPHPEKEHASTNKHAGNTGHSGAQNEDFDFWSMPQNDYSKKKKDFVENSNLWVNQKDHEGAFLTEQQPTSLKKKK